uniref:Apple domain-containing protein n=1 Tax=Steinernema glaseri TaxID=37863 RepID=A0A1I7YQG9_9BILA
MRAVFLFLPLLLLATHVDTADEAFSNGHSYYRSPKKQRKPSGYAGYGVPTLDPSASTEIGPALDPTPQVDKTLITGIPDLSDPCFRRYANCIIVNAQPYERRSSTSLAGCKGHCLKSQIGVYSCRSFVYDNINQVCDLFAHNGDQTPARLMKFHSRDYFEPTGAITCSAEPPTTTTTTTTSFPPSFAISGNKVLASATDTRLSEPAVPANNVSDSTESLQTIDNVAVLEKICGKGKTSRFLKTEGFELHAHDDETLLGVTVDECVDSCVDNRASGKPLSCKSFDYRNSTCVLSSEAAVPLGNGQLKQRQGVDYYEKICVDERVSDDCPMVFSRFPQMILVGFAETVTDASSFEQCFDNCLNSKKLYGFACSSGMYYFEEPQLNCILNTEDRNTQKELFTEENSDIVDYFETGCGGGFMSAKQRRFRSKTLAAKTLTLDSSEGPKSERLTLMDASEWTQWSECAPSSHRQSRRRLCGGNKACGRETRQCVDVANLSTEELLKEARKAKCPPDVCCPAFGGCQIGILQNSKTRTLEWCHDPCRESQLPKLL